MKSFLSVLCILCLWAAPVRAAGDGDIRELKEQMQLMREQFDDMQASYEQKMVEMQERIDELENKQAASAGPAKDEEQVQQLQDRVASLEQNQNSNQGLAGALNRFNPSISVIGDLTYHTTDQEGGEADNEFNFREAELAFSANVDTYARGDFFVAIENEDGATEVALEEGYLTLLETPVENLQGKFGKFRPAFGKANRMHLHSLAWADYPKVVQNYLGEEGFSEAGASASYLIPNPWDVYSELTLEGFNNNDAAVMGGASGGDAVYLAHLKEFFEFSEALTLEVGGSQMYGENNEGEGAVTRVSGADVTWKWKSQTPGSSHGWAWQSEALFSKREQIEDGEDGASLTADDLDSWGMYSSLEHSLTQRWSAFGRYDFSQMPADSDPESRGYSTGLTFAQSEYAFWRVQFTHTDHETAEDANEVWLQLNFGIGPHRAHTY